MAQKICFMSWRSINVTQRLTLKTISCLISLLLTLKYFIIKEWRRPGVFVTLWALSLVFFFFFFFFFFFSAHLSTTCSEMSYCDSPLSGVRRPQFASNDISSVTSGRISIKVDRIVPLEIHYQNCSNHTAPLHKMAAKSKNKKGK